MIPNQLRNETLQLRPFVQEDEVDVLAYWQSDPGWERFNASVPTNFTSSDASAFVTEMRARNRDVQPNWAIEYQGDVVGIVSLTLEQDSRTAIIGYGVHAGVRGRGMAAAATALVISEAFTSYPQLAKISAHTNGENLASMKVLEKLGFSREGLLRRAHFVKGRWVDDAIYGLLREEWDQ
ncbi:MAG: GNAT family N-acetyltransferase [Pseudomonadales bacterium]|nr:GNAT family N-acetyltransferase [Pseudomonadales bacterium]